MSPITKSPRVVQQCKQTCVEVLSAVHVLRNQSLRIVGIDNRRNLLQGVPEKTSLSEKEAYLKKEYFFLDTWYTVGI